MKVSHFLIRDQLCEALRTRILNGELAAGDFLKEEKLASRLGVSRTPMRQALLHLEEEGYVLRKARQGFEVRADWPGSGDRPKSSTEPLPKAPTLREQAADSLRESILSGRLAGGAVLRESSLATELGISRTPLREGLLILTREGLLQKESRRGFRVSPLEAREVRELYPLRALLEPQALREAGIPDPETLASLQQLNEQLLAEPAGLGWVRRDNEWHEHLVASCSNRHLQEILRALREHCLRYEVAFSRTVEDPQSSTGQHQEILDRLNENDLEGACEILAANMTISMEPLIDWLRE